MEKPDFSKYSEPQLRQILTRIDKARFPDRVEEIHARLAQLEAERSTRTETEEPKVPAGPPDIGGFWRRVGAFLIDCVLLALVGYCLGLFLHDQFEAMGAWGRAVGFVVALAYFGVMESRIFQGRTLGKLALDLQVVTTAGTPLGVGKAVLRSAVFNAPYFLSNSNPSSGDNFFALMALDVLLVFGLGGVIVYLCMFNRRTRQSIHDLLVGAVVVHAGGVGAPHLAPVWRGHIAMIAAMFLCAAGAAVYGYANFGNTVFAPLRLVQRQVIQVPGVRNVGVFEGTNFATGGKRVHVLAINAITTNAPVDEDALARRIAQTALATGVSEASCKYLDFFAFFRSNVF